MTPFRQCQKNANEGYVYVVDMDLEKFFDTVCQSKLIEVLSRTIKDGRVISLIHKYLNAGVIANGMFERTEVGMPQGGLCGAPHNPPYARASDYAESVAKHRMFSVFIPF